MMENSNLQSTSESLVEIEPNWCPKGPSAFMTSSETTTAIYVMLVTFLYHNGLYLYLYFISCAC